MSLRKFVDFVKSMVASNDEPAFPEYIRGTCKIQCWHCGDMYGITWDRIPREGEKEAEIACICGALNVVILNAKGVWKDGPEMPVRLYLPLRPYNRHLEPKPRVSVRLAVHLPKLRVGTRRRM